MGKSNRRRRKQQSDNEGWVTNPTGTVRNKVPLQNTNKYPTLVRNAIAELETSQDQRPESAILLDEKDVAQLSENINMSMAGAKKQLLAEIADQEKNLPDEQKAAFLKIKKMILKFVDYLEQENMFAENPNNEINEICMRSCYMLADAVKNYKKAEDMQAYFECVENFMLEYYMPATEKIITEHRAPQQPALAAQSETAFHAPKEDLREQKQTQQPITPQIPIISSEIPSSFPEPLGPPVQARQKIAATPSHYSVSSQSLCWNFRKVVGATLMGLGGALFMLGCAAAFFGFGLMGIYGGGLLFAAGVTIFVFEPCASRSAFYKDSSTPTLCS